MKNRILLVLTALVLVLAGACSEDNGSRTAKDLLAHVPSDAAYTAVINFEKLVSSTGGKIEKATVVEPSETLKKFLNNIDNPISSAHIDSILAGNAGVEFSVMVVFENEGNLWLAAPLTDPNVMKGYLTRNGYELKSVGEGLLAARDVVVDEDRVWLSLKDSVANAGAIDTFKRLNIEQSMMSSKYADRLTDLKETYIDLWDSNILWRTLGPSADRARMLSAFIFEEARYASFIANMSEKAIEAKGRFLDGEFRDAKCNLATSKLTAKDFDILGTKAQAIAGIALDSKLMKNITKAVGTFGGSLPKSTAEALSSIEGALVVASDEANNIILSVPCKKGKEQNVVNAIEGLMVFMGNDPGMRMTTKEGSVLISFNGGPQSGLQISRLAEKLSGAWMGLSFSAGYFPKIEPVKNLTIALVPAKSTLEFSIRVDY